MMTVFVREILFTFTLEMFAALLTNLIAYRGPVVTLPTAQGKPKSNAAYIKKFTQATS